MGSQDCFWKVMLNALADICKRDKIFAVCNKKHNESDLLATCKTTNDNVKLITVIDKSCQQKQKSSMECPKHCAMQRPLTSVLHTQTCRRLNPFTSKNCRTTTLATPSSNVCTTHHSKLGTSPVRGNCSMHKFIFQD